MNLYLIIGIVIVISTILYFIFFKGGVKKYFNKTLVSIDAHKKKSITPLTSVKKSRLSMFNRNKLMTSSSEEDEKILDFGEEANQILNDILNKISKKLCDKESTKNFPMRDSLYNKLFFSLLKDIYNSNKFTTQEKEDYLAVLSLLSNTDFSLVNNFVKITSNNDKKLAKLFIPNLDISKDLLLTFDQFKTINFNMSISLFNPEKFIEITKITDNTSNLPGELFNLLLIQQLISGTKLSDQEKARINIYIFGEQEPDYKLFKNDINGNILNKLFIKLNGTNEDYDQKINVLINASILLTINNMLVEDEIIPIINTILGTMPAEISSEIKNTIIDEITSFKNIFKTFPICEVI